MRDNNNRLYREAVQAGAVVVAVLDLVEVAGSLVAGRERCSLTVADHGQPHTGVGVYGVCCQDGDLFQQAVEPVGAEVQLMKQPVQVRR